MSEGSVAVQQKTTSKAWLMFSVIFLMCLITPILWFAAPPLHNSIAGLMIEGEFMVQPGYSIFLEGASNQAMFGYTMSLIGLFGFVSALISGPLVKKIGVKAVMALGIVCVVISGVISAMSGDNYTVLLVGRSFLGLAVGFIWVSSPTALTLWFPEKNRGLAMGIWGACVPVGALISTNLIVNPMLSSGVDFHMVFWVMTALAAVAAALLLVIYRNPEGDTEVSAVAKTFKEVWPIIRQHQVIMLIVIWMLNQFINSCFTSYNVSFFQTGLGMDYLTANGWVSIAAAAGIVAPLFGVIADKINRNRKWILVTIGTIALTLTGVFGLHVDLGPLGSEILMILYLVVSFLCNGILIAAIRPYIPMFVGKGGVTAVSFALSGLTLSQFFIQFFTAPVFGGIYDMILAGGASSADAWANTSMIVIIPCGIVAIICSFFIRFKKEETPKKVD